MPFRNLSNPVIVILGPTGVGKTDLSIQIAERIGGEIVSADSRYFYRGMDIGTAKPSPEEQRRTPHHLIDVCDPDETWSLAIFKRAAREAIAEIHGKGSIPIVVGGTGQYIHAVVEEWDLPQQPPDPIMRIALERWAEEIGAEGLYSRLASIDPEAASHIEPRNLRRTVRALEVIFHTGRLFSEQRRKLSSPYQRLQIGLTLPRAQLYQRIDERIARMIADGLLREVQGLLAQGYAPDLPAFSAIGYREMIQVAGGLLSMDDAIMLMKRATRQFVRRQANWFKLSDPEIHWIEPGDQALEKAIQIIQTADWLVD